MPLTLWVPSEKEFCIRAVYRFMELLSQGLQTYGKALSWIRTAQNRFLHSYRRAGSLGVVGVLVVWEQMIQDVMW